MFDTGVTCGDVDVLVVDFRTMVEASIRDEFEKSLCSTPAMTTQFTNDNLVTLKIVAKASGCETFMQSVEQLRDDRPTIVFGEIFLEHLSEEGIRAVYEHELAHVHHGDLQKVDAGILENIECELQADAAAVQATSKEAMRGALLTSAELMSRIAAKYYDKEYAQVFREQLSTPAMVRRLTALT